MDFKQHLKRQLAFLERSCASYDAGYIDEAIRIAIIIRVLIHNTKRSTSLLAHLNARTIELLSTVVQPSPRAVTFIGLGMINIVEKGKYVPCLGNGPPINRLVSVDQWWGQIVMVLNGNKISREDIVLVAANKDGGAHVDSELSDEYEALAQEGAVGSFIYTAQEQIKEMPIQNVHLVSLRQLGYEVLHSPELLQLAV